MNHSAKTIAPAGDVLYLVTSNNGSIRPEKLLDVLAYNDTGATLYLLYFDGVNAVPVNGTQTGIGFPVGAGQGGTLGKCLDISGGIWVWSTTPVALTVVEGASGTICIVLKG